MNWDRAFQPPGQAGATSAPMNVDEDSPPGAGGYASGPLANPKPVPTPTPKPNPNLSLTTIAAGGMNHAQLWMSGEAVPPIQQQPFNAKAPAVVNTNRNVPSGPKIKPEQLRPFSWASGFDEPSGY